MSNHEETTEQHAPSSWFGGKSFPPQTSPTTPDTVNENLNMHDQEDVLPTAANEPTPETQIAEPEIETIPPDSHEPAPYESELVRAADPNTATSSQEPESNVSTNPWPDQDKTVPLAPPEKTEDFSPESVTEHDINSGRDRFDTDSETPTATSTAHDPLATSSSTPSEVAKVVSQGKKIPPPYGDSEPTERATQNSDRPETLDPTLLERALPAALSQTAHINTGEMIGVKVIEQPLDHDEPIAANYLNFVRQVYAKPTDNESSEIRESPRRSEGETLSTQVGQTLHAAQHPHGSYDAAFAQLRPSGGVLVLALPQDTGRTITAHALLADLVSAGLITEVRALAFGGSRHFPVRRLPRQQSRGYILELPPDEDDFTLTETFGADLAEQGKLGQRLAERDSRLIVLTRPAQWHRISRGASQGIAPDIGTARPNDIAERWLRVEESTLPVKRWLNQKKIQNLLHGQNPTDVLQIVQLILSVHRTAHQTLMTDAPDSEAEQRSQYEQQTPGKSFDEQVADVVAARKNWEDKLHEWHENPQRTSFQRNFLVAAAAMRGATVGHIYDKAAKLASEMGEDKVATSGQQVPGVIAMTRAIWAHRNNDGTLSFTRPYWDDAALEYFWNDRPLARAAFLRWLAQTPLDDPQGVLESITQEERRMLAERIGDFAVRWAVRHRRQEPLEEIIKAWYQRNRDKKLWPLAVNLLDGAASQPASASYIHEMLLAWAKRQDTWLQLAVAEVCSGEFGRRHTGKALRRLQHIAHSENPKVVEALRKAVHTLWEDISLRPTLFNYVVEWCKSHTTVGRRTFITLAASTKSGNSNDLPLLLDEAGNEDGFSPYRDGMITGWRTLLSGHKPGTDGQTEIDHAVFLWLDTGLEHAHLKEDILQTLRQTVDVDSSARRPLRDTLRISIYNWAQDTDRPASTDREKLWQELIKLLDGDLSDAVRRPHTESTHGGPATSAGTGEVDSIGREEVRAG